MRLSGLCLLLAGLAACASPAYADDCASAQTTMQINECQFAQLIDVQIQLDALYKKRLVEAKDRGVKARKNLIASQKAYEAYSKAECERQSQMYEGGTMAGIAAATCLQARVVERINTLKSGPEADE